MIIGRRQVNVRGASWQPNLVLTPGRSANPDFMQILEFWTQSFAGQDAGLRSTVLALVGLLAETFGQ